MAKKSMLAIDISDHSIEALVLAKPIFGRPKVVAYARTLLRGKIVENGIIKNPEKLIETLAALFKSAKPKPIKTRDCVLSLPDSAAFTTIFSLPAGLRKEEIKNTILFKAEEVMPYKSAEVYFDFKAIEVAGDTQEIFYAAVPIKTVDSYLDVLSKAGLRPVAFDLESISSARALFDLKKNYAHAKLMMDIGARTTELNIFDKNGIRQSETLKIAGDRFTRAIMTNMKVTAKVASDLKIEHGFNPKDQADKIPYILRTEAKKIIKDAKKFIDFYQLHSQRKIDEIKVIGGSALLPSIEQYLADSLSLEANLGDPLEKINDSRDILKAGGKAVIFTNVIGLALRGLAKDPVFNDINLLPAHPRESYLIPHRDQKKAWKKIYIGLVILISLALTLGGIFYGQSQGQDIFRKILPMPKYDVNLDYSINQFRDNPVTDMMPPTTTTTDVATSTLPVAAASSTPSTAIKIKIKPTSTGYLNVRAGAGVTFAKVGQVNPGEMYNVIKQQDDWYQINFDQNKTGWILSTYADIIK